MLKYNITAAPQPMSLTMPVNLTLIKYFITTYNLDFQFLTETWLRSSDISFYAEHCPPNYVFFNSPGLIGHGGGLAVALKKPTSLPG